MRRSRLVVHGLTSDPVALGMVSGGLARLLHVPANVDGSVRLGYPRHFVTLGAQDALTEGSRSVPTGVPDPFRARRQRRSR